jgi:hypothetical protein
MVNEKLMRRAIFQLIYQFFNCFTWSLKYKFFRSDNHEYKYDGSRKGLYWNSKIAPQSHKGARDSRVCGVGVFANT